MFSHFLKPVFQNKATTKTGNNINLGDQETSQNANNYIKMVSHSSMMPSTCIYTYHNPHLLYIISNI